MLRLFVFCLLIVLGGSLPSLSRAAYPLLQTVAPPTFGVAEATSITDSQGNTYDPATLAAQVGLTADGTTADFGLFGSDYPGGLLEAVSLILTFPFDIPPDSQVTVEGYISDSAGNRVTAQPAAGIFQAGVGGVVLVPNQISVSASVIYDANLTGSYQFHWDALRVAPRADISGIISDESGQPLPAVTLTTDSGLTTTSDLYGDYRFDNLPSGNHTLTPTLPGYVFTPAQTTVTLPPTAYDVNFVGTPDYTISGAISDESGQPLPNVTLTTDSGLTTTSDLNGDYDFSNLLSGSYTLTPTLSGYSFTPPFATTTLPPDAAAVDFTAAPEDLLSVTVYDPHNNPINTLSLNNEGWYAENPISITVSISNTTGQPIAAPDLTLTIDTPIVRFYVITETGLGLGTYTNTGYEESVTLAPIGVNDSATISWRVWVQPDEGRPFNITADLTDGGTPVGDQTTTLTVPQASIYPVVLVPGYIGTWPPSRTGSLDPLHKSTNNIKDALQILGYELGTSGSGASFAEFPYDWRQSFETTGDELEADVNLIINTPLADQKPYVNYNQVNIIAHSAGGIVSRAFIEDATPAATNNAALVHKYITLGSPHSGVPATYRARIGGQPEAMFSERRQVAQAIFAGLFVCDDKANGLPIPNFQAEHAIAGNFVLNQQLSFNYINAELPSSEQLLPIGSILPDYLVDNAGNPYPWNQPPNPFLEDLANGAGNYNVQRLGEIPEVISVYGTLPVSNTNQKYEVIAGAGPVPGQLWGYGEVVHTTQGIGDGLVPEFSAKLTNLLALAGAASVTNRHDDGNNHMDLLSKKDSVGWTMEDITGQPGIKDEEWLPIPNHPIPPLEINGVPVSAVFLMTCSPIRTLVTDAQGRRAGLDLDSGQILKEIPGAIVGQDGDDPHLIGIPDNGGVYQIQTKGIDNGEYTLDIYSVATDTTDIAIKTIQGLASPGQEMTLQVNRSVFQANTTEVVMEAEHMHLNLMRSGRLWQTDDTITGFADDGYISVQPTLGQLFTQAYTMTSPELQFDINFTTPGTYTLWLRGYASAADTDSVYVTLDEQPGTALTGFAPRQWSWANRDLQNMPIRFTVSKIGLHTLRVWQREDGLRLDRLLLTTDNTFTPTGIGPVESVQQVLK